MYPNRLFSLLVILALAMVITLTFQEAVATKSIVFNGQFQAVQRHRGLEAEIARWAAMGEYYENLEEANLLRSRNADSARWTAMNEYYQKLAAAQTQHLQRSRAADAARWTAMAEYYIQLMDATH